MNAAIYARKSTEQVGRVEEQRSVVRQQELARAFAASRGWVVLGEHVYVDDGISGAEFERRPGFMRMMASLTPRPPFQVLIVSEQKSIGREMAETMYVIKQLSEAGVEVFEYMQGRSLTPRGYLAKMMAAMQSGVDEGHREDTSRRVHESHSRSVRLGHAVGGRVFGYRNVDVIVGEDQHGRPLRSHVDRVIDPAQAEVVRRIFELYDSGLGLKSIVKRLTGEGALAPAPFRRKDGLQPIVGWAPSTVRTILSREIYQGVMVWNKSRKRTEWGKVDQRPRPKSEWIRAPKDDRLQIVSDDLWERVAARRRDTEGKALRFQSGRLSGRPPKHATKNLLAGLATCALCGGGLVVETSPRKRGRIPEYVCHRHRHNGTCSNVLRVSVDEMNEAVLRAVEEHALTPEAIEQVILLTERDDVTERRDALDAERRDVERRINRVVAAIEAGGEAVSLIAKLRDLERRKTALSAEVVSLRPIPRIDRAVINERLSDWRRLLRQSTTQGRAVLQRVLRGRLTFTPWTTQGGGQGYNFSGPTRFDKLFTGIIVERSGLIAKGDLTGTENIRPEDTFDRDYGRLLDQFYGKGVASPTGFEPVFWP